MTGMTMVPSHLLKLGETRAFGSGRLSFSILALAFKTIF
jgi:hypothetical protein